MLSREFNKGKPQEENFKIFVKDIEDMNEERQIPCSLMNSITDANSY